MGKKRDTRIPETAELLVELATLDEVSAWTPTSADHSEGITPEWCELVLEITRTDDGTLTPAFPINQRLALRRHDGELIIQVLWDTLHPTLPTAASEQIWDALDDVVDRIQRRVERGKEPMRADVGEARGLAMALASMISPMEPDLDMVRDLAMDRYATRNGLD